ncbi:MAG: metallophosphoesterase [Pseudomonadota bacterium]
MDARRISVIALVLPMAFLGACGDAGTVGDAGGDAGDADIAEGNGDSGADAIDITDITDTADIADIVDGADAAYCGNGNCEAGETCETCPADCPDCGTCPDGICDPSEDCSTCSADCGPCPPDCGGETCAEGERCVDEAGADPFCTNCDPDVCAAFGVICCPHNAPDGGCTNMFIDSNNCGACNAACGPDQICSSGECEAVDTLFECGFESMQWWRSPTDHDQRDITFVAFGDTHAADPTPGCPGNDDYAPDQNRLIRDAVNSASPSIFWEPHVWPPGAGFLREGEAYDHVRGVVIAGDLTHAGSESIPAGSMVCREYRYYRDAFGRCGSEGRLWFPVYDVYGNHDFPRSPYPGDVSHHPVIDRLDSITAAHRPGASSDLYDDASAGTGHHAWRWDDIWFVNVDVKPGYNDEFIEVSSPHTMRIVDPHGSRGFLKEFLQARTNNSTRQIVIVAHYPLSTDRIDAEEKESFCRLIHNAQHGTGDFTGQKLSMSNPVVAYIHGHNHHVPEYRSWTCPSPYNAITIPMFSAGTPLYRSDTNSGMLHFTIFRLGTNRLEVVGIGAPAGNPTGPWTTVYTERLDIMRAP